MDESESEESMFTRAVRLLQAAEETLYDHNIGNALRDGIVAFLEEVRKQ